MLKRLGLGWGHFLWALIIWVPSLLVGILIEGTGAMVVIIIFPASVVAVLLVAALSKGVAYTGKIVLAIIILTVLGYVLSSVMGLSRLIESLGDPQHSWMFNPFNWF
jgi:hypothetical protein